MAKIKRKKSKAKTSRRRRHGPSTWNRFVKSHAVEDQTPAAGWHFSAANALALGRHWQSVRCG